MRLPPGRMLSQNDWPKTTRNYPQSRKTLACKTEGRAVLLVLSPCCSPPGCPFPINLLLGQRMCLLGKFISER